MKNKIKPSGYWDNFENCYKEALKYKSRSGFKKCNSTAYKWGCKNNWMGELCSHMIPKTNPIGYWNDYENCKKAALECTTRTEFYNK